MTFTELTTFLKTLGAEQAMNLDGGSSSSFYYQGKTSYGKVDTEGYPIQRPVKSVLLVLPSSDRPTISQKQTPP
jgi:exopolysaccharide biosynthesis protein